MKLSDQVCSLELPKKLEKLEIKQDSLRYWSDYESDDLNDYSLVSQHYKLTCGDVVKSYFISAFTVAELGEMLPNDFMSYKKDDDMWLCCKHHPEIGRDNEMIMEFADNEANARAKMLIYLIENKLVKVEDL